LGKKAPLSEEHKEKLRLAMVGRDRGAKRPATPRAPAPESKTCIGCVKEKPIAEFHFHKQMKDGYLNKCKQCCSEWTKQYRAKRYGSLQAFNQASYARELELGSRTRVAPQKYGIDLGARTVVKSTYRQERYARKRNPTLEVTDEFDLFVIREAIRLRLLRSKMTGIEWQVDHVVPINHADACGLHNAFNLQVVPASWNMSKRSVNMDNFWPVKQYR
jgi:hypothetical protein